MSLVNSLTGYVDYKANKWKQDPEAKKYIDQKGASDAVIAANAKTAEQKKKNDEAAIAAAKAAADAEAAEKEQHFNFWRFMSTLIWTITIVSAILILAVLTIASGSILANHGVDLPVLLRLFYFIYGALFFFVYIPFYYIVEIGVYKKPVKIRAILPIKSEPFTWSWLNSLFGWMIIDGVKNVNSVKTIPAALTAMSTVLQSGAPSAITAIASAMTGATDVTSTAPTILKDIEKAMTFGAPLHGV